jgi:TPR repeat protein
MSVLIWGQQQRSISLEPAGVQFCPRCGLAREHAKDVDYQVNHLYYVFGFVSGRKLLCRCVVCGYAEPLAPDAALAARATARIPVNERLGCLGAVSAVAGLVLLAVVWGIFGPQPRNIPDLLARVERGDASAVARLEAEAKADDVPSQEALAQIYRDGLGVPPDPARAFTWAKRAGELGSARAQYWLGNMYELGLGTTADPAQALMWFQKAAEQGLAGAANNVGVLYIQGHGVAADPAEAARWFLRAADGGDAAGTFNLALRYLDGQGVAADPVAARRLLELAATAVGDDATTRSVVAGAQQQLGEIYELGKGVERDLVKALHYYEAASPFDEDARAGLERLRQRLNG